MKNPKNRLKVCNRSLGIVLLLILASGIQLEATAGRHAWSVWTHVVLGVTLCTLSFYHIYLHYKKEQLVRVFREESQQVDQHTVVDVSADGCERRRRDSRMDSRRPYARRRRPRQDRFPDGHCRHSPCRGTYQEEKESAEKQVAGAVSRG